MNDKRTKDAIVNKSLERLVALCELEGINITGEAKESVRFVLSALYDTAHEGGTGVSNCNDCAFSNIEFHKQTYEKGYAKGYRDALNEAQRQRGQLLWPWR